MKLKKSIKFQATEFASPTAKYYLILFILFSFTTIISYTVTRNGNMSGIETISTIFIFILMLSAYREHFNMLLQNGISRKTFFLSTIITGTAYAFILIILDTVMFDVFSLVLNRSSYTYMTNIFEQIYPSRYDDSSFIQKTIESILLMGCVNMVAMSAGLTISSIYYRLTKVLKIIVFTAVPASVMLFFPTDQLLFNGFLSDRLSDLIKFSFGVDTDNPFIPMITLIILSFIGFGISWLFIRRSPVKEK